MTVTAGILLVIGCSSDVNAPRGALPVTLTATSVIFDTIVPPLPAPSPYLRVSLTVENETTAPVSYSRNPFTDCTVPIQLVLYQTVAPTGTPVWQEPAPGGCAVCAHLGCGATEYDTLAPGQAQTFTKPYPIAQFTQGMTNVIRGSTYYLVALFTPDSLFRMPVDAGMVTIPLTIPID